jgi:outer membrane protein TolC
MTQRLDLVAAKQQVELSAKSLGLSRVTRFVNVLDFGVMHNSSNQAPRQTGYEISFEIPLFDWGDARVAKAEAIYMQSVQRAAQAAVEARSEVREAYQGYRSSHDIALHYRDEIVPTAKRISDENLLRYNGMFIGVFELLADAREQIAAVNASIEALRDFWIAQADLEMALIGKPGPGPTP